jgi:hypothetical protein
MARRKFYGAPGRGRSQRAVASSTVSRRAVALWKASSHAAGGGSGRVLKDLSGKRHHLYAGSTKIAAILDGRLELTGVTGNYASTPAQAAHALTGDIEIIAQVTPASITQIGDIVARWNNATSSGYLFRLNSGNLEFVIGFGGSTQSRQYAHNLAAGETVWLRATRTAAGVIVLYKSPDGATWTSLGSNAGNASALADSANALVVGGRVDVAGNPFLGAIHRAIVKDSIDGTTVFDVDFTTQPDRSRYISNTANLLDKDTSDLEGSIGQWVGSTGTPAIERSIVQAKSGAASLLVTAGSTASVSVETSGAALVSLVPCVPLTDYVVMFSAVAGINSRTVAPFIRWYDIAGNLITSSVGSYTPISTSGWSDFSVVLTAPANAYYLRGGFNISSGGAIGDTFFIDEIGVYQASSAQTWSAGGTPVKINTSAATTNDPKWLPYDSTNGKYVYLPALTGNYVGSPDSAALSITGDITIDCHAALDDWTPASESGLVTKWDIGSANRSYILSVLPSGVLRFYKSGDGTAAQNVDSSVTTGAADGSALWCRASVRVSDGRVRFYTSSDGAAWTQLGTDRTITAGAILDGNAPLAIGAWHNTAPALAGMTAGKFYAAKVYSSDLGSSSGTPVFDWRAADMVEPFATVAERSVNAATVTVNRSTTGRKTAVVDRSLFLLGTDDYLEAFDHDDLDIGTTDALTAIAVVRQYGTPSAFTAIMWKKPTSGAVPGWGVGNTTGSLIRSEVSDSTTNRAVDSAAWSPGVAMAVAVTRDVTADEVVATMNGVRNTVTDTTTGSPANTAPLRVGARGAAPLTSLDGEFVAGAVFREALSAADFARVATELVQAGV